jgi:hypothetical protein
MLLAGNGDEPDPSVMFPADFRNCVAAPEGAFLEIDRHDFGAEVRSSLQLIGWNQGIQDRACGSHEIGRPLDPVDDRH